MISRRTFLGWCGAAALASTLPIDLGLPDAPQVVEARVLTAASLYRQPAVGTEVVGRLWPDSVLRVREAAGDWYATGAGYLRREDAQPMLPLAGVAPLVGCGWVCVNAPVAPLRAWAAADAPLVGRVGYGGVMAASDRLVGIGDWLGVAPQPGSEPLGWTSADRWAVVDVPPVPQAEAARRGLRLDRVAGIVLALEGEGAVLRLPAAPPAGLEAGRYRLEGRAPSGAALPPGAAWVLRAGPVRLYGAHWHNRFGRAGTGAGWEVHPALARWLYGWLPEGAPLDVV